MRLGRCASLCATLCFPVLAHAAPRSAAPPAKPAPAPAPEPAPPAPVVTPPPAPLGKFQAVGAHLPVAPLLDALQRESAPGKLCISSYSAQGMDNADQPLAAALEDVLKNQKGLLSTAILAERNGDDAAVAQLARAQGCALVLRVTAFPADPGTPYRVLFSLRDLDGDELATTVSTRCLARLAEGDAAPEAQGALGGLDFKTHVTKEKLSKFRKRSLTLSGNETYGWRLPLLRDSGRRISIQEIKGMTDDPELLENLTRFEREDDARESTLTRSYLFALLGPGVGVGVGALAGAVGAGVGALFSAGSGLPAMAVGAGVCGVILCVPVGVIFSGVGAVASALVARVVAGAVTPLPEDPMSLDVAKRLVVEGNVRTAADLDIDVEDLPGRYLPVPRPKGLIKDRVQRLKDILEDAADDGSSGDAPQGGQP